MKRLIAATLMLVTLVVPATQLRADQASADVLTTAPAEAWAVAYVRNVGGMDQKLNTLIQQLNLPIPFQNPVSMGLTMFGFMSGLDTSGDVGVVIMPAPSFNAVKDNSVLLIPTTNLNQLLSLMQPEPVEEGISKVLLDNRDTFVAQKGGHAVLSPSLDAVKAVLASKTSVRSKLNAYQAKHFEKDDVVIWINAEAVTSGNAFQAMLPVFQMVNFNPEMLTQLRGVALSMRIGPAGIGFGFYTEGIPGTELHQGMSNQKSTTDSLLIGLPKDRFVVGYGAIFSKEACEIGARMLTKVLDNPQLQTLGLDPEKLERVKSMIITRFKLLREVSVGISGLPEGPDGMIAFTKVVGADGDPKEGMAMIAELVAIIKGGLIPQEEAAPILSGLEYKPGAEIIGSMSVDHLAFDLTKASGENAETAEDAIALVSKILGKDGILFRIGVVDDKRIIVTLGGGAERFKTVATLVQQSKAPLADDAGIQRSKEHLPSTRNAEGYLAVDHLLNVVSSIGKAADAALPPMSLGELNAPIAFAAEPVEPGGSQAEVFLPMELVIAVKDMAMATMSDPGMAPPPPSAPVEPPGKPMERKPKGIEK